MDTLRAEVADGDGRWRPLERIAGDELSLIVRLAEFRSLPARTDRTFPVRLHLDPAQPGTINSGAALTVTRADGCPTHNRQTGFDLPVRGPDPAPLPTPTSPIPLLIGAAVAATATLCALWLITLRRRSLRG